MDNKENKLYEIVDVCPHCDYENVYRVPLEEAGKPIRACHRCGRKIFICSECDDCVNFGLCDWHENPDGSSECYRGRIEAGEKEEKKVVGDERLKQIIDDCLEWMMYDNFDVVGTLRAIHFDDPDELRALGYETLATSVEEAMGVEN